MKSLLFRDLSNVQNLEMVHCESIGSLDACSLRDAHDVVISDPQVLLVDNYCQIISVSWKNYPIATQRWWSVEWLFDIPE